MTPGRRGNLVAVGPSDYKCSSSLSATPAWHSRNSSHYKLETISHSQPQPLGLNFPGRQRQPPAPYRHPGAERRVSQQSLDFVRLLVERRLLSGPASTTNVVAGRLELDGATGQRAVAQHPDILRHHAARLAARGEDG